MIKTYRQQFSMLQKPPAGAREEAEGGEQEGS